MPRRRVFIDTTPLRKSRDLRFLIGGQLVSLLGTQLTAVAVPYQVYRLTHSSLDVGLVSLAQLIPLLLCSLYGGAVIDATDRRRLILRVELAMACCSAGLAVNTDLGAQLWPLFTLPAITSGLTAFDNPARNAIFPRLVSPEHIAATSAMFQVLNQLGMVVGPALGGILLAGAGINFVYWIDAASFVVAVAAAWAIAPQPPAATAFGNEVSVVSGGLLCIAGALVLARLMPGLRTVQVGAHTMPADEPASPGGRGEFPALWGDNTIPAQPRPARRRLAWAAAVPSRSLPGSGLRVAMNPACRVFGAKPGTSVRGPRSGDCPGDEGQHERRDDDRHPRVVQPVPALVLLSPVGGVVVGCPRSGAVGDRDEQGDRHDDAHDEQGRRRDGCGTGRPAPLSGGQPGREEQGPDVPERHHAAEHPGAVGVGLQRGSGGQPQQHRVDEDRDGELDADHDADDGCGDDSERGEHGTPFLTSGSWSGQ